ncbi:MAG: glycerol-3-phosphate 1-O-acyltransferase PlsY [Oscillospiraceae bacterium]|nr:glycerol-3-phosphate 1-O-acyltransferase PlsY [Oscillospiraceae bacterium]
MRYLILLSAYLIGSVNPSIIFSRLLYHQDIREIGSKNAGFTNTLRCLGSKLGALVFLIDVLKGFAAVWLVGRFLPEGFAAPLAGLLVVLGHIFPVFFRFKGGKGVATAAGVILALQWPVLLGALAGWGIVLLSTRYMSLASITGAALLPFLSMGYSYWKVGTPLSWTLGLCALLGITVIVMHRGNIRRLRSHTEHKFWGGK